MSVKKGLFFAFAAIIILIPVYVAVSSQNILNNGKLYKFKPMAYDPFDPFRGKFLRVNYETGGVRTNYDFKEGEKVYVSIGVDKEGFAFFDEGFKSPPKDKDYLQTTVDWVDMNQEVRRMMEEAIGDDFDIRDIDTRSSVKIKIPDHMEKYFINEDDALPAEYVMDAERDHIYIGVRILDGESRLDDIFVHGKPILEYLADNKSKR